ncbi:hypothetical protein FNV43_RR13220 [Rhamnella rubrinervis]|uniref:Cyclin C-terminal domain-containing protein n=1 Tax=Rhamnella rubrinervis TaxID=2594499 RepID=A0A8K0H0P3_9ROSA|nr:hypothetical protein FNV43_RR13220 [Rhamnella rubrinervis]
MRNETKAKKALPMTTTVKTTQNTDTKSDDPQLCGPYVSDVYAHLHELEAEYYKTVRFLSVNRLNRQRLQLLGVSSMLIASRFTRIAQENYKTPNLQLEFLGYYLAELSLLDYNCVKFLPSLVAASVVSCKIYDPAKDASLDLRECVLIIHDWYLSRRGGSLQAVRDKYKQHKFKCVATMPSPPEIPAYYFEDL